MQLESLKKNWRVYLGLLLIVGAGAYFRVVRLDLAALRADTIHFWNICRTDISAWQIVTEWTKLPVGQPPFPLAVTKWYIDLFHLPVNHFTLAFPNALFGIFAVPVMFLVGRRLGGNGLGLVLAALLALNPFHIQTSREAYFYSSLILGACVLFLGVVIAAQAVHRNEKLGAGFYWASGLGFFLITQSQFTGWSMAFVSALAIMWLLFRRWQKTKEHGRGVVLAAALFAALGILILAAPWGLGHMMSKLSSPEADVSLKALAVSGENMVTLLQRTPTLFAWGSTPARLGFTVAVLVLAILVMFRDRPRWHLYGVFLFLIVGTFLVYALSRKAIGAAYESRYISGLLPVYLSILALGLWQWPELPWFQQVVPVPQRRRVFSLVTVAVAVLMLARPADTSTRLTGSPVPYKDVLNWVESNLDRGIPVLVDRWFEPWNELKVYESTNVYFTFTVPNEPVDVYLNNRWRDTAVGFFTRYPEAAYLEIAKSYFDAPGVGFWQWPRQRFARHVIFRNRAGLELRELGLASRGDFYAANTNRVVVELFYNTRQDLIRNARKANQPILALYGPAWRYVKTQDYRDWRMLEGQATLDVYNVTEQPVFAAIRLRGVAVAGSKQVSSSVGAPHTFSKGQIEQWDLGTVTLEPGLTQVALTDSLWEASQSPLLVEAFDVQVVKPQPERAAAAAAPAVEVKP